MPPSHEFETYFHDRHISRHNYLAPPKEDLTSVSYWPALKCDFEGIATEYHSLQPRGLGCEERCIPSWECLSASQSFSVQLVKRIISDLLSEHHKILLVCWQVACAAASSHVICPGEDSSVPDAAPHATFVHIERDYDRSYNKRAVPCVVSLKPFSSVFSWFRGCLFRFCPWMNQEVLLQCYVNKMVEQLKKNGRTGGVGILMSSNQVIAVAVEGSTVCHTGTRPSRHSWEREGRFVATGSSLRPNRYSEQDSMEQRTLAISTTE
ncbi:CHD5 domain protein [Ceratobasidium sp. AG-Ba]|nr:CHD5 domain protein [Ceratobasidium sp. AG-Ba]